MAKEVVVKIVLKTKDEIYKSFRESYLEDEKDLKLTNGIEWLDSKLRNDLTLDTIECVEEPFLDILANEGDKRVFALDWISHFEIKNTKIPASEVKGVKYLQINEKDFYDIAERIIVQDVPLCKCCGTALTSDNEICPVCVDKLTTRHSYNYVPEYTFHGNQIPADKEYPTWFGLELEYGLNSKEALAAMMLKYKNQLFLKEDGSIEGGVFKAEVVSHPHSYTELMSKRSFIKDLPKLDIEQQTDINGCHIHVSRTGFVDDRHFGLFYFLVSQSKALAEHVGNRSETEYCRFSTDGIIATKANKKQENASKKRAVNEKHDNSIEIRFFNSTNKVEEVNCYLQYLESMVKYTRYVKKTASLVDWVKYVKKYRGKYKDLYKKLGEFEGALDTVVEYREPIILEKDITSLTIDETNFIQKLEIEWEPGSIKTYTIANIEALKIYHGGKRVEFRSEESGYLECKIEQIKSITLLK